MVKNELSVEPFALINQSFLVTGSAGFIGFHVARALLAHGVRVVGLDNFNDYYSVQLKHDRDLVGENQE